MTLCRKSIIVWQRVFKEKHFRTLSFLAKLHFMDQAKSLIATYTAWRKIFCKLNFCNSRPSHRKLGAYSNIDWTVINRFRTENYNIVVVS